MNIPFFKVSTKNIHMQVYYLTRITFNGCFKSQQAVQPEKCNGLKTQQQFYRRQCFCICNVHINCLVVLLLILTNSRVGAFSVDHGNQSDWYTPVLKTIIKCIQCDGTRNYDNDRNDNNGSRSTGSYNSSSNTNTKIIRDKLYVNTFTTILSVPIITINAKKPNQLQKVNKSEGFINYTYNRNSNIGRHFVKQQNNRQNNHQQQFKQWIYKNKHNNALFELIYCLLVGIFLELLPLILHRLYELLILFWELIQRHISLNGHCSACFCHTCANTIKLLNENYCILMQSYWNYHQQTIYFKQQKNAKIMLKSLKQQQQYQREHDMLNEQMLQLQFLNLISAIYETKPIVTGTKQVTSEHIFIEPNMCIDYYKNYSCCVILLYNVFYNKFVNQLMQNIKRHNLCRNMPQEQREYHDQNYVDSIKKQRLLDLKKTLLNHKWLILLCNIYKKQHQIKQNTKGLDKKFMLTLPYNKIIKIYGKILNNKNGLLNTSKNKISQQKHQVEFTDTTYKIINKAHNKNQNKNINNKNNKNTNCLKKLCNKNISNSKYSFHRNFLYISERNYSWCCCCYPSNVDNRRLLYSCELCAYMCCCYCYYVCPYYKHCKCQYYLYCCYSDCCLYNSYIYDKLNNKYGLRTGAKQQYQQKKKRHNSPSVHWSKTSFQKQKHFSIHYCKYFSNCCCCCYYFYRQSNETNLQEHKSDRILINHDTTSYAKIVSTTASTRAKIINKNKPYATVISISLMKQKLLQHLRHFTCYCLQQHLLATLLRATVFPQNEPQYPQQQQNVAHFRSTIVTTNSHNLNSTNQYCIAYNNNTIVTNNRQQWQKGQLCKMFYNNRKRQRGRRRRRRRRRRIDDQLQQQQQLQMLSKSKVHLKRKHYFYELQHFQIIQNQCNNLSIIHRQLQQQRKQHQQFHWCQQHKVNEIKKIIRLLNAYKTIRKNKIFNTKTSTTYTLITSAAIVATTTTAIHSFAAPISTSIRIYRRHTKPNLAWLFISLVCFDGPKLVNSNIINHHQEQQQQQNRQQNGHQQKQEGTKSIHIPNMNSTTIFKEYKIDYKNNDVTKIILGHKSNRSDFKIYYNNSRIDDNANKNVTHKHSNNKKLDNSNHFILIYTKRIHNKNEIYNNKINSKNNIYKSNNNNNTNTNNNNNNNKNNSKYNINTNNYIRNCTNMAYHQNYQHRQLSPERRQRETKNAFSIYETIKSDIDKLISGTNGTESATTDVPWYDLFYNSEQENSAQNDRVRLESIKLQILSKLGLTRKPNISQPLPKQFVWDTIYRAEGIHSINDFQSHFPNQHQYNKQKHQYQKHMRSSYVHSINNDQENIEIPYNKHKHQSYRHIKDYYDINNIKTLSKYSKENKIYNKQSIQKTRDQFIQNSNPNNNDDDHYTNVSVLNLVKESTDLYNNDLAYISNQAARRNFHEDEHSYKTLQHITKQQKYKIQSTVSPLMPIPTDMYSVINVKKYFLYDHERSHNVPIAVNNEENDFEELQGDDYFGSTQEIITFGEQGYMYNQHRLVEFSPQQQRSVNDKLYIHSAEIHIRIDKLSKPGNIKRRKNKKDKSKLKIWIFKLNNNFTEERFDQISKLCAVFNVNTQRLGWQKFDLTQTVREWYEHDHFSKLRLLIDCTGCERAYNLHLFDENSSQITAIKQKNELLKSKSQNINNIKAVNTTANVKKQPEKRSNKLKSQNKHRQKSTLKEEKNAYTMYNTQHTEQGYLNNPYRPFLVLHTETRKVRRVRRRAIDCMGAQQGQCCKESFYVSFKALGWDDWIIAPRGYFANYCRGDCTGPYRTPDTFQTFHAHFIEEYRKMGLLNGMQPCCAPVKFSSMSLIYYGNDGIIKRDLPKMVVDECGCP